MKRRRAKHATPEAKPRLSAEQIQKLSETLERTVMGQAAFQIPIRVTKKLRPTLGMKIVATREKYVTAMSIDA